jgi:hypothetical protein
MNTRRKTLLIASLVLLAGGLAAGFALAQESTEGAEVVAETSEMTFLGRVAANLGIEESALVEAMELARLQEIDAAVADGSLTEEQAEEMKARIEARASLREVIEDAIASGELTEEQVELLGLRGSALSRMGGLEGLRERLSEFREELQEGLEGFGALGRSRQMGFIIRSPRGMITGRICGRP